VFGGEPSSKRHQNEVVPITEHSTLEHFKVTKTPKLDSKGKPLKTGEMRYGEVECITTLENPWEDEGFLEEFIFVMNLYTTKCRSGLPYIHNPGFPMLDNLVPAYLGGLREWRLRSKPISTTLPGFGKIYAESLGGDSTNERRDAIYETPKVNHFPRRVGITVYEGAGAPSCSLIWRVPGMDQIPKNEYYSGRLTKQQLISLARLFFYTYIVVMDEYFEKSFILNNPWNQPSESTFE
jgi:hypothetical protein